MNGRRVTVFGFAALLACATQSAPKVAPPPSAVAQPAARPPVAPLDPDLAHYRERAPGVAARDAKALLDIAWKRFRRGSMLHNGGGLADRENDTLLDEALGRASDDAILAGVEEVLRKDASYIRAHVVAANVLEKLGRTEASAFHGTCVKGLLGSIAESGDGRTAKTAFVVFHVREEYDVLQAVKLELVKQNLQEAEGRTFDVLTVKRPDGSERALHFDITEMFQLYRP